MESHNPHVSLSSLPRLLAEPHGVGEEQWSLQKSFSSERVTKKGKCSECGVTRAHKAKNSRHHLGSPPGPTAAHDTWP